jgi:DNA-directed RNA polymerase subunit RPC12/RpoP
MIHATNNATFECTNCGKDFWTDQEPNRCTACQSFNIIRKRQQTPHIETVAAMVAAAPPLPKQEPIMDRPVAVTTAEGKATTYPSAAEAAKVVGCKENSLKVAMAPSGSHRAGGCDVRWADEKPRHCRVKRKAAKVERKPKPEPAANSITQRLAALVSSLSKPTREQILAVIEWADEIEKQADLLQKVLAGTVAVEIRNGKAVIV